MSDGTLSSLLTGVRIPDSAVVVGPPGSGKTTLAVGLANSAASATRVDLIVASEHLVGRLKPLLRRGVQVATWRTWLTSTYNEVMGRNVPRKRRGVPGVDWASVMLEIEKAHPISDRQLILDEAQDIPRRLVTAMGRQAGHLFAFTDPLQRQVEDGCGLEDLVEALGHEHPWPVYVLEEDFRTTFEIQQFAVSAWAHERISPSRPARRHGPRPRVLTTDFVGVAKEAGALLASDCGTVMIACAHADRAAVVSALAHQGIAVNRSGQTKAHSTSVLAFETLRGLEFDAVVLIPPLSPQRGWSSAVADLYVAATRATHQLTVAVVHEPFPDLASSLATAVVHAQAAGPLSNARP